jgi:hypothetical protein
MVAPNLVGQLDLNAMRFRHLAVFGRRCGPAGLVTAGCSSECHHHGQQNHDLRRVAVFATQTERAAEAQAGEQAPYPEGGYLWQSLQKRQGK